MNNRIFMDVHVLQTVPPSCVNRDDTGSPKTAVYGGVTRARVSSQSWKHAIREMVRDEAKTEPVGLRTKKVVDLVKQYILKNDPSAKADKAAKEALQKAGVSIKEGKESADALFFMSEAQAEALAELALKGETDKAEYKKAITEHPALDMILFGRMVANDPSLNYDATAQVAHAIAVHATRTEFDYFTAVDDCGDDNNAGAAHLGTVEYNSSTLYRYTTVNVSEMARHLGDRTAEACALYLDAFIRSMPTGKQNTFANRTLPDAVYVTIRSDQPVNLVGAFEKPITTTGGYADKAQEELFKYADALYRDYVGQPVASWEIGKKVPGHEVKTTLPVMLEEIRQWVDVNMVGQENQ